MFTPSKISFLHFKKLLKSDNKFNLDNNDGKTFYPNYGTPSNNMENCCDLTTLDNLTPTQW